MKQMIVIRKDLGMRKGKMVAQGAHASMAAILSKDEDGVILDDYRVLRWLEGAFTKVCVSVNSEEELLELHKKAQQEGMLTALITDSGLTEFQGVPTNTAIAIGPDTYERCASVTGHLKLL